MNLRTHISQLIAIILISLCLASTPLRINVTLEKGLSISLAQAHAKNGSDNSGKGNSNDDRDDDDGDDDDDDKKLTQKGNGEKSGKRLARNVNFHIKYSNGWDERIRNGRYRLLDPKGRKVADRWATTKDLKRMRGAAGQ